MRCEGMTRIQKRGLDPIFDLGLHEDIAQMGLDGLGAYEKWTAPPKLDKIC